MLVFIKMKIALGFLVFCAQHAVGGGEFCHNQPTSAEIPNEAAKDGVGNARHGGEDRSWRDCDASDLDGSRNDG